MKSNLEFWIELVKLLSALVIFYTAYLQIIKINKPKTHKRRRK